MANELTKEQKKQKRHNIYWRIFQGILCILMNAGGIAWFTMKCINIGEPVIFKGREIQLDYFSAVPFGWKCLTIFLAIAGVIGMFFFIAFLWKNKQHKKERAEDLEIKKQSNDALADTIDKLFSSIKKDGD